MSLLALNAYLTLIRFDVYMARRDFAALYQKVKNYPIAARTPEPRDIERIIHAIDMASIWYWKEARCLQRSAATACLLKKYGIRARMVIGVQHMPFRSHAWVEVDGRVVNDKPYLTEMYAVLDRC